MKYRQRLVSSSAPASLQEWLAEELERRGIDGVYTRYILSLLLADTIDPTECSHFAPNPRATTQVHHVSENKLGEKSRHRRLKSWEHKKEQQGLLVQQCQHVGHCCDCCQSYVDNEQRKKLAAVECLKSASEQKGGIEKLIDEVCAKLKNFQADIETNPDSELHAEIKGVSKPSSPQGQAELYYAAFPALSGKPEPLGELCHHSQILQQAQEAWTLKSTVWGKENRSWSGKPLDINKLAKKGQEQENEEIESELGKENLIETDSSCCRCSKALLQRGLSKETEFLEKVESGMQPLFIVPKMKVPPTKVANITMYTPFTSAATYQQQGVGPGKVPGEEDRYSDEGEEEIIEGREGSLLTGDEQCLTWKLLLPNVRAEENDLVTDLASKFNSELAAIWETSGSIQEPSLDTDNLGFSFSILSVRSPVQEDIAVAPPTSINFFIGSSLPSVWSAKTEDIKILSAHDACEPPEPLSSPNTIPGLVHNLTSKVECTREDNQSLLWSSEEDSDFFLDDGSSLKSFKLDLSEQAWEDISQACEGNSEERNALFVCPEVLFVDPEENERPASLSGSSDCLSPLESTAEAVTGIYNLWESPSPQPPFPLKGEVLHIPLNTAPYSDKVVNWISHQREILNGNWQNVPVGKENRTLTYHKGESRFKEVVPLARTRADSGDQLAFPDSRMALQLEDCGQENLEKPEEPEENLLTSPKTHFQPIRQDSSETDSLSDTLDIIDPQLLLLSPHHHNHQSPLVIPPPAIEEKKESKESEGDDRPSRSVSSSMDEMLLLTGQFEPDEEESKAEDSPDTIDILQAFQSTLKPELLVLEDKSTSTDALYSSIESTRDDLGSLGFGPFHKDQIWSSDSIDEQASELALPWKWSTTDDSEDILWKVDDEEKEVEDAFEDDIHFKKSELDCTLEAMRKELEEEEEELFRDINLLSDSEDFEAVFGEDFSLISLNETWACADVETVCAESESPTGPPLIKQWELDSTVVGATKFLDDSKSDDPESLKLPSVPVEKVLYSSELESEWHKASQSFNVQVPRKGKVKTKIHGQPQQQQQQQRKPCSFFLEGNCRRSDCKFSHNLGTITCRFWEEGSCFKGITCPFLHGYASDSSICNTSSGKCKFALESEADFPSLSTLSSSEPSCKPFPKDLVVGRIIRPKKKKMGPVAAPSGVKKSSSPLPPK